MKILPIHPSFKIPTKSRETSAGYDVYMPEGGIAYEDNPTEVKLGFAAEIPPGYVALLLPRSGVGIRAGLELNNTCGVMDADYRGEWIAHIRTKKPVYAHTWEAGDRLIQVLFIPVINFNFEITNELNTTERGVNGFGSSGK